MAAWMPAAELAPDIATRSPVDPHCGLSTSVRCLQRPSTCCAATARWRAGAFAEIEDALLL
jgi:hypothetical protein